MFFILFTICLFALLRILITYGKNDEDDEDDNRNQMQENNTAGNMK